MNPKFNFDNYSIGPVSLNDAEAYYSFILNNKATVESAAPSTAKTIRDLESAIRLIEERLVKAANKQLFTMLVKDNTNGKVIASIVLTNIDLTLPKGELGYFIDKSYERKGIMTKAVSILCDYFFHESGFNKLFMRISDNNLASRRVAEKNGFMIEGHLRKDYRSFNDELEDKIYYGKVKDENKEL